VFNISSIFCLQKKIEDYLNMLNDCYKYAAAINAKGEPFPVESLNMALLLSQRKMIDWLKKTTFHWH
jgi:hypothetical protein